MIRTTLLIAAILGTAATALASVKPTVPTDNAASTATSIFYKVDAAPKPQHIALAKCALEDCSDTPQ